MRLSKKIRESPALQKAKLVHARITDSDPIDKVGKWYRVCIYYRVIYIHIHPVLCLLALVWCEGSSVDSCRVVVVSELVEPEIQDTRRICFGTGELSPMVHFDACGPCVFVCDASLHLSGM